MNQDVFRVYVCAYFRKLITVLRSAPYGCAMRASASITNINEILDAVMVILNGFLKEFNEKHAEFLFGEKTTVTGGRPSYTHLTVKQLKALSTERGLKHSHMNKKELVTALKKHDRVAPRRELRSRPEGTTPE